MNLSVEVLGQCPHCLLFFQTFPIDGRLPSRIILRPGYDRHYCVMPLPDGLLQPVEIFGIQPDKLRYSYWQ